MSSWVKGQSGFLGYQHSEASKKLQSEARKRHFDLVGRKPRKPDTRGYRDRREYKRRRRQTEAGRLETEQNRVRRILKRNHWRIDRFNLARPKSELDELTRLIEEQKKDDQTYCIKHDLSFDTVEAPKLRDRVIYTVYDNQYAGIA